MQKSCACEVFAGQPKTIGPFEKQAVQPIPNDRPDLKQRNPLRFPSASAIHMALIARQRLTPGPSAALRQFNSTQEPLAGCLSKRFRLSPPDFLTAKTKDPKHNPIC
jgi:hypothetical protein